MPRRSDAAAPAVRRTSRTRKRVRFAPLPPPYRAHLRQDRDGSPRTSAPSSSHSNPVPLPSPLPSSRSPSQAVKSRQHLLRLRGREALNDLRFYLSAACNLQGDANFWLALSVFPVNALVALTAFVNALRNDIDTRAVSRPEKLLRKLLKSDASKRHPHEFLDEIDPADPNEFFENPFERNVLLAHRKRARREAEHCLLWFVSQQLRLPVRDVRRLPSHTREQRELDAFKDRIRKFNTSVFTTSSDPSNVAATTAPAENTDSTKAQPSIPSSSLRRSKSARVPSKTASNFNGSLKPAVLSDDVGGGTSSAPQSPAGRRQTGFGYGLNGTEGKSPRSAPMGGLREPIEIASVDGLPDIELPQATFDASVAMERRRRRNSHQQHFAPHLPPNPHPASVVVDAQPQPQGQFSAPLQTHPLNFAQQMHPQLQHHQQPQHFGGIMHDLSIFGGATVPETPHSQFLHTPTTPSMHLMQTHGTAPPPQHVHPAPQFFHAMAQPSTPAPYHLPPSPGPLPPYQTVPNVPPHHFPNGVAHHPPNITPLPTSPYSQAPPPPPQHQQPQQKHPPTSPYTGPIKYGSAAPPPASRSFSPGGPPFAQGFASPVGIAVNPSPTTPSPKVLHGTASANVANPVITGANVSGGGLRYSRTPPPPPTSQKTPQSQQPSKLSRGKKSPKSPSTQGR